MCKALKTKRGGVLSGEQSYCSKLRTILVQAKQSLLQVNFSKAGHEKWARFAHVINERRAIAFTLFFVVFSLFFKKH